MSLSEQDQKILDFVNAKTVWVKVVEKWEEVKPICFNATGKKRPFEVEIKEGVGSWVSDFKLEKPKPEPKDMEVCLCWDNDDDRVNGSLYLYKKATKEFYMNIADYLDADCEGYTFDNYELLKDGKVEVEK